MAAFKKTVACVVCVSVLGVAGCADPGGMGDTSSSSSGSGNSDQNQMIGTLVGVGLGALVGSQFGAGGGMIAATIAGAAVGGLIGNRIGAMLDEQSRQKHEAALKQAVANPAQGQQSWHLDQQNSSGTVTPLRSFSQNGKQCTEVMQTVYKNGQTISDTNSYCREGDGSVTLLN